MEEKTREKVGVCRKMKKLPKMSQFLKNFHFIYKKSGKQYSKKI